MRAVQQQRPTSERGLVMVSSTDNTRQAASVAAVMAFAFTSDGSHTYDSNVSIMPPVSTQDYHCYQEGQTCYIVR